MIEPAKSIPISRKVLIGRGFLGRCPKCGVGKIFASYLKAYAQCPACGEDFSSIRADDGPTWLTIILTGHLAIPMAIYLSMNSSLAKGPALALLLALIIGIALLILPRAKGIFIAMIWRNRQNPKIGNGKYDRLG